jgi:hypothetical protein
MPFESRMIAETSPHGSSYASPSEVALSTPGKGRSREAIQTLNVPHRLGYGSGMILSLDWREGEVEAPRNYWQMHDITWT